jgi:hypothetical protein
VKLSRFVMTMAVFVLLAGCSDRVVGSESPSSSVATSTPAGGEDQAVPKVAHPLDVARYEKDPCATLTAEQLSQLGITTQAKPDLGNKQGPACEWNAFDEAGLTIGATLLTVGSSLSKVYKQHDQGQWPFFKPVADVSGYPGVLVDSLDAVPKGKCQLVVAVRDDLIYSAQIDFDSDSKDYADPCPVVQKAAEMAVSTMKAGA